MSLLGIYNQLAKAQETASIEAGNGFSVVPTTSLTVSLNDAQTHFIVLQPDTAMTDTVHLKDAQFFTDGFNMTVELLEDVYTPALYTGTITISGATCELNAGDFAIAVDSDSIAVTVSTLQSLADIISTAATALDTSIVGCNATFAASVITVTRSSAKNFVEMTITHTASCTAVEGVGAVTGSTDELLEFTVLNHNRNSAATSAITIGVTSSSVTTQLWKTATKILERFWIHGTSSFGAETGGHGVNENVYGDREWVLDNSKNYAYAVTNTGTSCFVVPRFFWYEKAT